tara:strand:- start:40997 stop:42052 length:1056 start_codon:yes stop_codon:yes gene_type:complete
MNFKHLILPFCFVLGFASCEKSTNDEALSQNPEPIKKTNAEFPYEVYEPNVSNEAQAFYEGALAVFNSDSAGNYTAINKSIWIMEGSMNSFFGDSAYLNEDSIIIHESTFIFERNQDGLLNGDIVANFTSAYQQIKALLNNNDDYTFNITDIQVADLGSSEVSLVFRTHLLANASSASSFAWPNVPPATVGRYAGASAECGSISGDGAWEHVQWQARQTLPSLFFPVNYNFRSPRFNVVFLNSDLGASNVRHIDGSWMLGQSNALYPNHVGLAPVLTCVSSIQQDGYSQKLSDELYSIVSKRNYWDGVSNLRMKIILAPNVSSTAWFFDCVLSKNVTVNANFSPCTLGVDC